MYDRLIERGTILKSSWSPSGRDCAFYQVVNRSRTHAIIREIDALYDVFDAVAIPSRDAFISGSMRRKIRHFRGQEFVLVENNDRALVWDGAVVGL